MVSKINQFIQRFYLAIIFIFLYAPIAVLIIFSFNESRSRARFDGFTLKWYINMFKDPQIMDALYYTLIIAILSSLIATIIGTAAAIGISHMKKLERSTLMNLAYLPMLNADIVTGISLMLLFIFIGLSFGMTTMLLAHITFNIPYVILAVLPKIKQLDQHVYEAALDLGATPFDAYRKVIIPEIMPGIISGALIAFTMSFDDFVISFFTAGNGVSNLSIVIYSMAKRGVKPEINALSSIMFISVLTLLLIVNKLSSSNEKAQRN
ncbi:ABC transporter permease [Vallitalea okinawensis]|uniref:ABC transporter permease n=1 Tax=Vallitalea okinawensis TaxID=2078660 RepID=UPI000CFBC8C6|nr:ABC transporter permease [Vallitalea okinawensis]